jgi:signal transduction histidine kinase
VYEYGRTGRLALDRPANDVVEPTRLLERSGWAAARPEKCDDLARDQQPVGSFRHLRDEEDAMAATPRERLAALIRDVEKAARQLRTDIQKRAQAAPRSMEEAAMRLRKGAADIAGQVEKYIHDLRVGLQGRRPAARRAARRKATRRKATRRKTRRATR